MAGQSELDDEAAAIAFEEDDSEDDEDDDDWASCPATRAFDSCGAAAKAAIAAVSTARGIAVFMTMTFSILQQKPSLSPAA